MGVSEIQNMGCLTYKIYNFHGNFQYRGYNRCTISYIYRVNLIIDFTCLYAKKMKIDMQSKKNTYV